MEKQLTRNQYRKKLREQRLLGVFLFLIAIALYLICLNTKEDAGAVLVLALAGFPLVFSKKIWIY